MATTNDKQVIFSLVNVGNVYPPKKQVLREIYLGFYFGAKIGVLGLNGSGKSSLLRIIAGVDQNYTGEITRSKGYSVGLLEQEPQLDPDKTVKEIVEEGKKELVTMLHEYDEVSNKMGEVGPTNWKSCSKSRRSCKRRSKRQTDGNWTTCSSSPWMRCVVHRRTQRSECSQAARSAGWPFAA